MIIPDLEFEPMLLPHHKGRKRMHLGKGAQLLFALTAVSAPCFNTALALQS